MTHTSTELDREECTACNGTGSGQDGWDCLSCSGDGWVFVAHQQPAVDSTSTEQPEALRLADWCDHEYDRFGRMSACAAELRRLHARILELEASQAQRVPLSDERIDEIFNERGQNSNHLSGFIREIVRNTETEHGITQEKQG